MLETIGAPDIERSLLEALVAAVAGRTGLLLADTGRRSLRPAVPVAGLPEIVDGLPYEAIATGTAVVDLGPVRPVSTWGLACAAVGMASAVAVAVRPAARRPYVVVVGDPADAMQAARVLDAVAPDVATVLAVADRLRDAADRSTRAAEQTTLSADLIAIVSHELRTPLTSIIGSLQTLQRPQLAPPSRDAQRLVQTALAQADRLRVLVDDLLVASRLDRDVLRLRMRPVDVPGVVREILDLVPDARSAITVSAASDLPRPVVDPDHLARIVRNLVENVLRHAPGAPAEIRLGADGETFTVDVIDHGPGIADPQGLFERTTPPSGPNGGLGLGLAIARGLVDALGGTIDHSPTPGGGATLGVRLPIG
ncbi:MAG TPA: ATP-binding protein [Acidimicrobiia bacterium]|nr:ATP-binding protein [Acidimicrobiia bacterium]